MLLQIAELVGIFVAADLIGAISTRVRFGRQERKQPQKQAEEEAPPAKKTLYGNYFLNSATDRRLLKKWLTWDDSEEAQDMVEEKFGCSMSTLQRAANGQGIPKYVRDAIEEELEKEPEGPLG